MKKTLLTVLGLVLLIGMSIRGCRNYVTNFKSEHQWYVSQLNLEFSGIIDTIRNHHILFHITHGNLDRNREYIVNTKLKYNGVAALFLYQPNNRAGLMIDSAFQYRKGDSLYVNTNQGNIWIYRNHKLLTERSLVRSIKAKPYKDFF